MVINLIYSNLDLVEKLGLSFLVGMGLYSLSIFILSTFGMLITVENTLLLIIGLIAPLQLLILKKRIRLITGRENIIRTLRKFNTIEKALFVALFIIILSSFLLSMYWPVTIWDALALYDFRAKVIVEVGQFFQIANNFQYFAHYPLFTSLSHSIVYVFGGKNPQFIYSLMFLSFIIIFYKAVRRYANIKVSLVFTLLLATTPVLFHHSTFAYTNLPYTIYLVVGMIYLHNFITTKNIRDIVLSAIFIGLSTWVRAVEPFWITPLVILIPFALYRKRFFALITYLLIFFPIQYPWKQFMINNFGQGRSTTSQVSTVAGNIFSNFDIKQFFGVTEYVYTNVIKSWGILLLVLVILIVILENIKKRFSRSNAFLVIILVNFAIFIAASYSFSVSYQGWDKIPDSARRLSMFFIPLMIYYISISNTVKRVFK